MYPSMQIYIYICIYIYRYVYMIKGWRFPVPPPDGGEGWVVPGAHMRLVRLQGAIERD